MRLRVCVLAGAIAIGSTGCMTMASYESIPMESDPPGADVIVECGELRLTTVTPGEVLLARGAPDCRVAIRKEGYREAVVWLRRSGEESVWVEALTLAAVGGGVLITSPHGGGVTGEVAGEIIIGGLIPWIVNVATCNFCEHHPKHLDVVLRPLPDRPSRE